MRSRVLPSLLYFREICESVTLMPKQLGFWEKQCQPSLSLSPQVSPIHEEFKLKSCRGSYILFEDFIFKQSSYALDFILKSSWIAPTYGIGL